MIAPELFYIDPPDIPAGFTIDNYRRARRHKERRFTSMFRKKTYNPYELYMTAEPSALSLSTGAPVAWLAQVKDRKGTVLASATAPDRLTAMDAARDAYNAGN